MNEPSLEMNKKSMEIFETSEEKWVFTGQGISTGERHIVAKHKNDKEIVLSGNAVNKSAIVKLVKKGYSIVGYADLYMLTPVKDEILTICLGLAGTKNPISCTWGLLECAWGLVEGNAYNVYVSKGKSGHLTYAIL